MTPPPDCDALMQAGVSVIYRPGSNVPLAASEILGLIEKKRCYSSIIARIPP